MPRGSLDTMTARIKGVGARQDYVSRRATIPPVRGALMDAPPG